VGEWCAVGGGHEKVILSQAIEKHKKRNGRTQFVGLTCMSNLLGGLQNQRKEPILRVKENSKGTVSKGRQTKEINSYMPDGNNKW